MGCVAVAREGKHMETDRLVFAGDRCDSLHVRLQGLQHRHITQRDHNVGQAGIGNLHGQRRLIVRHADGPIDLFGIRDGIDDARCGHLHQHLFTRFDAEVACFRVAQAPPREGKRPGMGDIAIQFNIKGRLMQESPFGVNVIEVFDVVTGGVEHVNITDGNGTIEKLSVRGVVEGGSQRTIDALRRHTDENGVASLDQHFLDVKSGVGIPIGSSFAGEIKAFVAYIGVPDINGEVHFVVVVEVGVFAVFASRRPEGDESCLYWGRAIGGVWVVFQPQTEAETRRMR